ncbi:bifunctional diguanylate cyclase/phosphodiesterase [Pararhodobacter sp. CCB-MM2]|uniref:putative bifunctional diguanylate cyclase/phosphodiesterase n=1 Tax=Pararhodobacter sp. CCB-MM2 TaxID=1786003 RepID=UPI000833DE55|nr:bifunctional diguanylate cyclase/phosphodiesterase [Pararhodobacter sp. CCB-MM2]
MSFAPLVSDAQRHLGPAAQGLHDEIDHILSLMRGGAIEAAAFLPSLPENLPQLPPILSLPPGSNVIDLRDRLLADIRAAKASDGAQAAPFSFAARNAGAPPIVLNRIASPGDLLFGTLALTLTEDATAGSIDRQRLNHGSAAIAHVIDRWHSFHMLELDYAAELRRSRHLMTLAEQDGLTGLLGHQAFKTQCMDRLGNSEDASHALLMIDVDNFKLVNDIYGHQFGDHYLQEIARALRRALPATSLVGRIGGDEFGALVSLPGRSDTHLERLMLSCASDVQRVVAKMGKPSLGHISIGSTLRHGGRPDLDALMLEADAALYANKSSGKSAGTIYCGDQHANFSALLVRPRFLEALAQDRILPFFQPVIDLATGQRHGFELLARWQDPQRGLLTPGQFSSVLTAPELAEKLTEHVFEKAFAAIAARPEMADETLALNLGTADLIKQEFVFDLQSQLNRYQIDWDRIVIEVTETTMLGAVSGPIFQNLSELRRRGARVALDDFGTGYGGLTHLRDWPVDILKIDRSYIAEATRTPRDAVLSKALIDVARTLELTVIAEGIENAATAELLRQQGCHMAQGYYFARPAPLDAF